MKPCKAFHEEHDDGCHFLVAKDYMSGKPERYTVLVWCTGKVARIIGRELTLGYAKRMVAAYPKYPPVPVNNER